MSYVATVRRSQEKLRQTYEVQVRAHGPFQQQVQNAITGTMPLAAGASRNNNEALSLNKNWPYAAVNAIAKRVASQPVMAGELEDAAANPDRSTLANRKTVKSQSLPLRLQQKAVVDQNVVVLATHPSIDDICHPNHVQKKFEFMYFSVANLLLTGTSYWIGGVKEHDEETFIELWAVPSTWIQPKHDKGLFAEYNLILPGKPPQPIPPETVARTYLPDPSDIKGALAPLKASLGAARIDDLIINSQESMFKQGILPKHVITMAATKGPDGIARRPRLTGGQRRQILRAIRATLSYGSNANDPAIVDGMIDSIHKLQMTPSEMDWQKSGEVVKRRLLQTFGVNPISLGEITGSNRAQATEAERHLCRNAVNPIIDAFSETLTDFLGPMYATPERLLLWLKPLEVRDPELDLRRWTEAAKNNWASEEEFRSNQLGLEPRDEGEMRSRLLANPQSIQAITNTMVQVRNGNLGRDQAVQFFMDVLEFTKEQAEAMAGEEGVVDLTPAAPVALPSSDEEPDEDVDDVPETESLRVLLSKAKISRKDVQNLFVKQTDKFERKLGDRMAIHFRNVIREFRNGLKESLEEPDPDAPAEQADRLLKLFYKLDDARQDLINEAMPPLIDAFIDGARTEVAANKQHGKAIDKSMEAKVKTTAEEIAARLAIEVPIDISVSRMPRWLRDAARETVLDTFQEDYWQRIDETTRDDIRSTLIQGIEEGHSMRRLARIISERHGSQYSRTRAMLVARSESPNMLNAGHAAGMQQIEDESGIGIGKEWVSAFQTFTRDSHAAMDGHTTDSADGLFNLNGVNIPWPAHSSLPARDRCNCFVASTCVQGDFVGGQRAWYSGTLTEIITVAGRRLTVTPNHPVMTSQGLRPASKIKPGQKLMAYRAQRNATMGMTTSRDHIQHKPTSIENVFEAMLSGATLSGVVKVRRAQMDDFYGDGESIYGDVDIVFPDWKLLNNGEFGEFQKRGNFILSLESEQLLRESRSRSLAFAETGVSVSSSSSVCRSNNVSSRRSVIGNISPSHSLCVGSGSNFDVSLPESSQQQGSAVASFIRNAKQRFAANVSFDEVVDIRNRFAKCHVYDLQSRYGLVIANDNLPASGESCNGIVTSNCLCTIISTFVDMES